MYSDRLLDRFFNPTMAGDVVAPTTTARQGNPTCGDVIEISLRMEDGLVTQAKFRTRGCAVAIAASDAICELALGKTITAAEMLSLADLLDVIGDIPEERHHCADAPLGAMRSAVRAIRSDRA